MERKDEQAERVEQIRAAARRVWNVLFRACLEHGKPTAYGSDMVLNYEALERYMLKYYTEHVPAFIFILRESGARVIMPEERQAYAILAAEGSAEGSGVFVYLPSGNTYSEGRLVKVG